MTKLLVKEYEIGPEARARLHALLEEVLDEMVQTQDLYGEGHDRLTPKVSSVEGLKVDVDIEIQLTPVGPDNRRTSTA